MTGQMPNDDRSPAAGPTTTRRRLRDSGRGRVRPAVAAAGVLAILVAPFGVAATGDALREGVRNGTTNRETEIIGRFNATGEAKGSFVTRQSNTSTGPRAGGGAIYGCRGAAGGTDAGSAPCLRGSNLANGFAFEFESNSGPTGMFDVATPDTAPFVTDGAGLVRNLNADAVDGRSASDFLGATAKAADADALDGRDSSTFADRIFAVVEADGDVLAHRGLASTSGVRIQEGFYRLVFDRDVRLCAVTGSTGADNNAFATRRIITVGKDMTGAADVRRVNVLTQFFDGNDFVAEDNRFDVQVVC